MNKKIANWLNLRKENILITDGAEGALLRFMSAFANVKDKVIYLDPSFGMYKVYCDIFRLRKYPLKLDMKKNFNLPSYKIVYESLKRYAKNQ